MIELLRSGSTPQTRPFYKSKLQLDIPVSLAKVPRGQRLNVASPPKQYLGEKSHTRTLKVCKLIAVYGCSAVSVA